MKIIHVSDLHFDSLIENSLDPVKTIERKSEILFTFKRLANYANDNGINAIIISGCMFDRERISIKTRNFVLSIINDFKDIDFIFAPSNKYEYELLLENETLPNNFYVFDTKWSNITYENINISGIVFNDASKTYLYETLNLDKEKINIVLLNGKLNEDEISLEKLKNKNINYLALGGSNIFEEGQIDSKGIYCYPGFLEGHNFKDLGPKGFVLLNIENDKIEHKFIPFAKREIKEVSLNITGLDSWTDVRKKLSIQLKDVSKEDLILLKLQGKYNLSLVKKLDLLTDSLNEEFYYVKVLDESSLEIDPKVYEKEVSLKGEFIRNVLSKDLDEDKKNEIIEYGIKALMKEDI